MWDIIFNNFLNQMVFTVGAIFVFGFLIALCRRLFVRIVGYGGTTVLLFTGIIGTPIHELSHALMCIIFGHRIDEIKLFDPYAQDGTLGYVNHSYNSRNIYHQIGNFFIGVAPIICGSGVILLLLYFLMESTFNSVISLISGAALIKSGEFNLSEFLELIKGIAGEIFKPENMGSTYFWIFIVVSVMIASHMELSGADIKGGIGGLFMLALLILAADAVLAFVNKSALLAFTKSILTFSAMMTSFLAISLVFCIALLVVAIIIRIISKIFFGR